MTWQYSPIVLLYAAATIIMLGVAYLAWKLGRRRGVNYWALTMLFCAIYSAATGLEVINADLGWKLTTIRLSYMGLAGAIYFWGLFAIVYSYHEHWLTRRTLGLLAFIPLTTYLLVLFADRHQLIYVEYGVADVNGVIIWDSIRYGPFFWVWAFYTYFVLVFSSRLIANAIIRSPHLFRGQARIVAVSYTLPAVSSLFYISDINPISPYDPTPLILAVSGIGIIFALKRYRFLDIVPVAHNLIFSQVRGAIMILDNSGRIVEMNTAAESILGRQQDDVIGQTALEVFPEYGQVQQRLDSAEIGRSEILLGGGSYDLEIAPITTPDKEPVGRIIMLFDISERKRAEQQALDLAIERERISILRQFISDMSHDLRTPLTSMKTTQYLMRRELKGLADERLDTLDYQTERLSEMLENMLTLLRLDQDDTATLRQIEINSLLELLAERYCVRAENAGSVLDFEPGANLPPVLANWEELDMALSNILDNAVHFTPGGGRISIHSGCENGHVKISIHDSGVGIAPQHLEHIFERFYRADSARGTERGGSGLGLSISKRIVERHGGQIKVLSSIGEGSQFQVLLPILHTI